MIKSKKGAEGIIWTVVILAASVLFLLVYTGTWSKLFGKSTSSLNEQIDLTADCDQDNVMNRFDKCPCTIGDIENSGCPTGFKITNTNSGIEDRACLTKCNENKNSGNK